MRMNIDDFKKFADSISLGFNERIKVDVLNAGRVPFINVGPQRGISLQRFEVEGLITMGYNVDIVEATVKVVVPAPVERITINAVIEQPVVEAPVVQEEVK